MERKKHYDALDWQTFSQKKNIEEIVKNTKDKNHIQLTAIIEICFVTISLAVDNVFGNEYSLLWWIVAILSLIPIVALLIREIVRYIKQHRPREKNIPNPKEMIDLFDNDTCYFILMAESYCHKFNKKMNENMYDFYVIETCFYLNKAIDNLINMTGCVEKIFSKDINVLDGSKVISITRLINMFKIMNSIILVLDSEMKNIKSIDIDNNYLKVYKSHKKRFCNFKNYIFRVFALDEKLLK